MPESRSRSRKRKAAAAASAAKASSRDVDKDAQLQTSVKEERYVPRFGSATKRARTGTASLSSSQPPPSGTDNRFTAHESEEQVMEKNDKTEDAALAEVGGVCSGGSSAAPVITSLMGSSLTGGGDEKCNDNTTDIHSTNEAVQEVNYRNSQVASIPGMSLSQSLPHHHLTQPCSMSPRNSGIKEHPCNADIVCVEENSTSGYYTCKQHTAQLVPQDSALSPPTPDPHDATTAHDDLDMVSSLAAVCVSQNTAVTTEPKKSLDDDGMNLDLLDPLGYNEEEEEEKGGVNEEALNDSLDPSKHTEHHGSEETSEDASLQIVDICTKTDNSNDVIITPTAADKPQQSDKPAITIPPCVSYTDSPFSDCDENSSTSATTHSRPVTISSPPTVTPPQPSTSTGSLVSQQTVILIPSPHTSSTEGGAALPLYRDTTRRTECEISSSLCGDEGGCVCECDGEEGGVEDLVVVGGDSGQLNVASCSQGHKKNEHTAVSSAASPDELLAVREMMDLTAHDLLESQLLDEATVPSCSPALPLTTRDSITGHSRGGPSLQTTTTPLEEGSHILHGLIEELSALNQFVLACKRELEAGRRQRAAWMRTHQGHRGR